jgi:WD40 repeat protein
VTVKAAGGEVVDQAAADVTAWRAEVDDAPVALSARDGLVAVAGAEGKAWILNAADGSLAGTVTLPGGLLAIALAPDGRHAAMAGPVGYAQWRRADGRAEITGTGGWSAAVAWADADRVAVASGRCARVLSADGEQLWATGPAASTVSDLAWLRSGRRLAVAAYGAVNCHERHQAAPVAVYPYVGSHLALAVSAGDRWICSGNQDASVHIWRTRDGGELTMPGYPEKVTRLAFDGTGTWLANDGASDITVWDFSGKGPRGTQPRSLGAHETITALAWRPGPGGVLASGGDDGTVALWLATAGRPGARLRPARTLSRGEADGDDVAVAALAWSGPRLLIVAYRDGRIDAYRLDNLGNRGT